MIDVDVDLDLHGFPIFNRKDDGMGLSKLESIYSNRTRGFDLN